MTPIERKKFGKTSHDSSRVVFGSACLRENDPFKAARAFELMEEYGINHIDTAPAYGDAEISVGNWMKRSRDQFFLATKTDKRSYQEAKEQFSRSLDRLQTDHVDLLQIHNLTDVVFREFAMGTGGVLAFMLEAKEEGLARSLGITGHGILAPSMHLQTLQRHRFDSVLLPCNYLLLQQPRYKKQYEELITFCANDDIAVQTIKAAAQGLWGDKSRTHITWYQPLTDPVAIAHSVQWVLGNTESFLISTGDIEILPHFLKAAAEYKSVPTDEEMKEMITRYQMQPLFDQ